MREKINRFYIYVCISLIFAQNIDCWYTLEPPLCFGSKIGKKKKPCKPQFYYKWDMRSKHFISWTCYPDVMVTVVWAGAMFYFEKAFGCNKKKILVMSMFEKFVIK